MDVLDLAKTETTRAKILKVIEAVGVMGMTRKQAAAFSGMPKSTVDSILSRGEVKEYIQDMQEAAAKECQVSRQDVIRGMKRAIDHAEMVSEPGVELRGWEAIAKLEGMNAPERHIHDLPEDTKKLMEAMQSMSDSQLVDMAGQRELIELSSDDYKVEDNG